jgi:hypothetical protein
METGKLYETFATALYRSLDKAHKGKLQPLIWHHPVQGPCYFVASERLPNTLYRVKPLDVAAGCDCTGYRDWGVCKHYALILEFVGMMPDIDDPAPRNADLPGWRALLAERERADDAAAAAAPAESPVSDRRTRCADCGDVAAGFDGDRALCADCLDQLPADDDPAGDPAPALPEFVHRRTTATA